MKNKTQNDCLCYNISIQTLYGLTKSVTGEPVDWDSY